MKDEFNPFPMRGYHGPELFCDREDEVHRLISNIKNGINTTLLSIRRMGKTGLLHHVFEILKRQRKAQCIYIDIYADQNLRAFTNTLATAVMKAMPEKKPAGKRFMEFLKSLRPVISFDAISGEPKVSLDFQQSKEYELSLAGIFDFLEQQQITVAVAIDEFQQVAYFPEKNTEALLRTLIQNLKNVHFIFSGSNKHLLAEMFSNVKRPFFSSTQPIYLQPIPEEKYTAFIREQFTKNKRKIQHDAIEYILYFSKSHTYYTQAVCNRLYNSGIKNIGSEDARDHCMQLLKEHENIFFQYRNLLTPIQWNLLTAIAKEDKVHQPTSKYFLMKHDVGTASNVKRALEALLVKEMIYQENDDEGAYYRVYDCFLSRWLEVV